MIYYKIPIAINDTLTPGVVYNNDDNPYNPIGTGLKLFLLFHS